MSFAAQPSLCFRWYKVSSSKCYSSLIIGKIIFFTANIRNSW